MINTVEGPAYSLRRRVAPNLPEMDRSSVRHALPISIHPHRSTSRKGLYSPKADDAGTSNVLRRLRARDLCRTTQENL